MEKINEQIIKILEKDFKNNKQEVKNFADYVYKLQAEPKNTWAISRQANIWADAFKKVANEWLWFDGVHITMQSTWISFDYIAYKNKMLLVYPESKIDINIVYQWDEFEYAKIDWVITYKHKYKNPFWNTNDNIIWWYCIIKNKRWEFITILTKDEFDKHRQVARWDFIWKNWYKEMCMKTLMKKSCKTHFFDVYQVIEEEDNTQYDLTKLRWTKYTKNAFKELVNSFNEWWIEYWEAMILDQKNEYDFPNELHSKLLEYYKQNQNISEEDMNNIWKDQEWFRREIVE